MQRTVVSSATELFCVPPRIFLLRPCSASERHHVMHEFACTRKIANPRPDHVFRALSHGSETVRHKSSTKDLSSTLTYHHFLTDSRLLRRTKTLQLPCSNASLFLLLEVRALQTACLSCVTNTFSREGLCHPSANESLYFHFVIIIYHTPQESIFFRVPWGISSNPSPSRNLNPSMACVTSWPVPLQHRLEELVVQHSRAPRAHSSLLLRTPMPR